MDLELAGAAVLITGAASGIGRATAAAFAREGARVGLLDSNRSALAECERELRESGAEVVAVPSDMTAESSVAAAVAEIAERFGGIDVAVGCAGISGPFGRPIEEITLAEWDAVLAVNVTGQFLLAKHVVPVLRRASHPGIVFLASDSSFVAAPGMVPYNASKGAVLQLTRALAVDLAPDGIRVNCVCPSVVDTPMAQTDLGIAPGGFAGVDYPVQSPQEVAAHVLYLASRVSRPVNGTSLVSDFGYLARSSFPA